MERWSAGRSLNAMSPDARPLNPSIASSLNSVTIYLLPPPAFALKLESLCPAELYFIAIRCGCPCGDERCFGASCFASNKCCCQVLKWESAVCLDNIGTCIFFVAVGGVKGSAKCRGPDSLDDLENGSSPSEKRWLEDYFYWDGVFSKLCSFGRGR